MSTRRNGRAAGWGSVGSPWMAFFEAFWRHRCITVETGYQGREEKAAAAGLAMVQGVPPALSPRPSGMVPPAQRPLNHPEKGHKPWPNVPCPFGAEGDRLRTSLEHHVITEQVGDGQGVDHLPAPVNAPFVRRQGNRQRLARPVQVYHPFLGLPRIQPVPRN